MGMPIFDSPWYAEMIERFRPESDKPSIDGVGLAILAGFCILAQAVDNLTDAVKEVARSNDRTD